jgi:hypothetical protein
MHVYSLVPYEPTELAAKTSWQQSNEKYSKAMGTLVTPEKRDRYGTSRLTSNTSKDIRACLKLEPPANFPGNQLSEEGPIQQCILSCIVSLLSDELKTGYRVSLDDLHASLVPEWKIDHVHNVEET